MRKESSTVQKCKRQMATLGFDSQLAYHRVKLILKIFSTLSGQLNNMLSQWMGNKNWNIGANLSTGEKGWTDVEAEAMLSGRLLNNGLMINGNFGYKENVMANSNFVGDFEAIWLLTKNGDFRLRGYNQTNGMMESATDVYNAVAHKHLRLDIVGKTYALRGVLSLAVFVLVLPRARVLLLGGQTSEEARARAAQLAVVVTVAAMFAVNLLFFLLYTLRRTKPYCRRQPVARARVMALLWECAPLAVYSALNTTTASLPKIVLDQVAGGDALGIYGPVTAPVLLLQVCATYLFTPFINAVSYTHLDVYKRQRWKPAGSRCCPPPCRTRRPRSRSPAGTTG